VSVHSPQRDRDDRLRPLSDFQADFEQFLDLPSQRRVLIATLPYGRTYIKQHPNGQQGQDYDVVILNGNSAFCHRQEFDRRKLKQWLDRDGHELRLKKGTIGEDWPSKRVGVRP
jgi:hypothetical protein